METNDEVVERQKLVDVEIEDDVTISVPKSIPTPASPINVPNINVKNMSSGDATHSRNSVIRSMDRVTIKSDKIGGGGTGSGHGSGCVGGTGGTGVIDVGVNVCGSNTVIGCGGSGSTDGDGTGHNSAKVTYINERRVRPHLHGTGDERLEFKTRPRKLLRAKDDFSSDSNNITQLNKEILYDESIKRNNHYQHQDSQQQQQQCQLHQRQEQKHIKNLSQLDMSSNVLLTATELTAPNQQNSSGSSSNQIDDNMHCIDQQWQQQSQNIKNYQTSLTSLQHVQAPIVRNHRHLQPNIVAKTNESTDYLTPTLTLPLSIITTATTTTTTIATTTTTSITTASSMMMNQNLSSGVIGDKFHERPIKHHSFVSEVPDVKHMERALLGLLDDFHSGKLKAFGSGCTMKQMTKIREQQESLAKLHFELAAAEEDALQNSNDFNATKAQENMLQLMQHLEELSISIEQLQTSHTGL